MFLKALVLIVCTIVNKSENPKKKNQGECTTILKYERTISHRTYASHFTSKNKYAEAVICRFVQAEKYLPTQDEFNLFTFIE